MNGRDRGLDRVRPEPTEANGSLDKPLVFPDEAPVPERTVLVFEQHDVPVRRDPRLPARFLEHHEREEPDGLGVVRQEVYDEPTQSDRFAREVCPSERLAPCR